MENKGMKTLKFIATSTMLALSAVLIIASGVGLALLTLGIK
jgi:hypothetical protein